MRDDIFRKMTNSYCEANRKLFNLSFIVSFLMIGFTSCKKDFEERSNATSSVAANAIVAKKPNVILFVANDFGFELPTYNGGQSYNTPNLDFMAANGVYFQQAYNHPDGSPSRMAILTGKYNFRNYIKWGYLPPDQKTIGNMLHDAGYATCWVGKWQLSGGDKRIRSAGFDKYLVFLPKGHGQRINRYKNPHIYAKGDYLPDSAVNGKYSEDMFYSYLSNFIDSNKTKPFFAIYATLLPAQPWVPTPDDPEFATWDPANDRTLDDKKYFPSMVSYIDKIVGKVVQKLQADGIADNTIIMWCSATQTDSRITSLWDGQSVQGTKTNIFKAGTNSPLLVYWPGNITPGQKSNALVDWTDFMPTLANVAHIPEPTSYGILDGTSFYDNMMGRKGHNRDWVFCQWDNNPVDDVAVERWVNNRKYKLYDTVGLGNGKFYEIDNDMYEKNPIPDSALTPEQLQTKQYFRSILDTMHN
jgi:arylsulfatase A